METLIVALLTALVVINAVTLIVLLPQMVRRDKQTHTRQTIAGIEDATAVLIDIEFEIEALKARAETARRILGATRTNPHAYDPDRPAGRRKNGR